ncbi:phage tail tube protein [Actinomadura sp. 21ATH]|uniref:phage tail tube protein n=1 Tax=Actinomadura sp. 21ATH TaxID=1735444 RepID=UPI0035C0F01B
MAITITGITPATGPTTGGTSHLITGTDMHLVTGVTVGGTAVQGFEDLSPTLLRIVTPPGTVGAKDVVLAPGAITGTGIFTYAAPTEEQLTSTLARRWILEVNTGTVSSPVWTRVRAIGELKPTQENNMEDDSDYDSDGWASNTKTQMSWEIETKILRKKGVESGNHDPGQEALRAKADQFGAAGTAHVRWYDREGGPEAYQGFGSVSWEPEGGDAKDLEAVTVKITGNGKRTVITNPAI